MKPGDVLSYIEMCQYEGLSLQRGMNYRSAGGTSIVLMSLRPGAPYADRVENEGRTLVYEGHNVPRTPGGADPKSVDQPYTSQSGRKTQNGLFFDAAMAHKRDGARPEIVRVYEKIRDGIWTYNGVFELRDAWQERSGPRQVYKFKLEIVPDMVQPSAHPDHASDNDRLIPSSVKVQVWKRDKGACAMCGSQKDLHFDHIIPYSKGGSSRDPKNIQILCRRHNLAKHDNIE